MIVYIDGNNLLHATGRWDAIPWRERRQALLEYLEKSRPAGSANNKIHVVFDGHPPSQTIFSFSLGRVIFSFEKDADTVIFQEVSHIPHPRNTVVVTNDRNLKKFVRQKGATTLSCEEFLLRGRKSPPKIRRENLSSNDVESLNSELKKIWKLD